MPLGPGGPRVLLRRLREIMAEPVSAQERLDRIVVLIAANMVAEVCSVYVMRGDGALELYATEGLNPRCARSDGLVALGCRELSQRGDEQRLVDPAVEDRDPQLDAPCDHLLALHVDLARQLRGRQVIRQGNLLDELRDPARGTAARP